MDPATLGLGLAGTLGNLGFGLLNMENQQIQNMKDKKFAKEMMYKQNWLNIQNWNRANAYNSPEQQMVRLKEAGLNPHLVYGNGADAKGGNLETPDFKMVNQEAPKMQADLSHLGDTYLSAQQVENQNRITESQVALQNQQRLLLIVEAANKATEGERKKFDLEFARDTRQYAIEQMMLENEKMKADINFTVDENKRQEVANSANVALTLKKVLSEELHQLETKQDIALKGLQYKMNDLEFRNSTEFARVKLQLEVQQLQNILSMQGFDIEVKNLEAELARKGILKSDPIWFRLMMQGLHGAAKGLTPNSGLPDPIKN